MCAPYVVTSSENLYACVIVSNLHISFRYTCGRPRFAKTVAIALGIADQLTLPAVQALGPTLAMLLGKATCLRTRLITLYSTRRSCIPSVLRACSSFMAIIAVARKPISLFSCLHTHQHKDQERPGSMISGPGLLGSDTRVNWLGFPPQLVSNHLHLIMEVFNNK